MPPAHRVSHIRTPDFSRYPFLAVVRHNVTLYGQVAGAVRFPDGKLKMDVPRKDARKKKIIRWVATIAVLAIAGVGITFGLAKLKPAAPSVEMSTLWPDTVKRGPMTREVRGLGTLVPEDTMLIPAQTDGRV